MLPERCLGAARGVITSVRTPPRSPLVMGVVAAQADQPPADSSAISPEESPVQAVTIPQAAQALDLSVITIRRRLKRGELRGQKVATAAGFEWRVLVPSALVDAAEDKGPAQGATQNTPHQEDKGPDQRLIEALQTQLAEMRIELEARRREVAPPDHLP